MNRGNVRKSDCTPVTVWVPNEIIPQIEKAIQIEDSDRSKFIRRAIRDRITKLVQTPEAEVYLDGTTGEVTVATGTAAHWFWLDLSASPATVENSDDPANNGWASFPAPDTTHIPIGYVDTDTYESDRYAVVRQVQRGDVVQIAQNPGSSARMFLITAVNGDSLTCVEWDGATQGSEVEVAKPIRQRTSNTTETVDGTDLTYTYSDSNNRLTSDGTNSQYEVCYPRYVSDDETYSVIWAVLSDNGTGVADVDWIEITTRLWLRKSTQAS